MMSYPCQADFENLFARQLAEIRELDERVEELVKQSENIEEELLKRMITETITKPEELALRSQSDELSRKAIDIQRHKMVKILEYSQSLKEYQREVEMELEISRNDLEKTKPGVAAQIENEVFSRPNIINQDMIKELRSNDMIRLFENYFQSCERERSIKSGTADTCDGSNSTDIMISTAPLQRNRRDTEEDKPYCYCKEPSYGSMVACDNPNCEIIWFHYDCVGIEKAPEGKWFCDDCKNTMDEAISD
ncbi:hypothetical protein GJ496_000235 [Pomphorhynchus laevis]|nr:hypothetical protein GJ496_000235 [Pomphorhynchus laevis]